MSDELNPTESLEATRAAPPFRADNGKFWTEALFYETNRDRTRFSPVFTLKADDHLGCRSLKAEYLRISDPTEYRFALEMLGSFSHWELLCSLKWFQPHIGAWRKELEMKLRSEASKAVADILSNPEASDAARLQAAKFLTDKGWERKHSKGRPSKQDVAKAAREAADHETWMNEDHERIFGGTH